MKKNYLLNLGLFLLTILLFGTNSAFALNASDCTGYTSNIAPTTSGTTTTVTTTHNIDTYNWSRYNLNPNENAFYQFTANGQTAVNYVNPGGEASMIRGAITGSTNFTGNVLIFNPNGMTITTGAKINNLNSFTASTNRYDGVSGNNVLFSEPSKTNALKVEDLSLNHVNNAHFIAPGVIFNATNVNPSNELSIRAIGGGSYNPVSNTFSNEVAVTNPALETDRYIMDIGGSFKTNKITMESKANYAGNADVIFSGNAEANTIVTDGNSESGSVYLLAENKNTSDNAYSDAFVNGKIGGDGANVSVNAGRVVLNGNIDTSGANGGSVDIKSDYMDQYGNISANGTKGAGGNINIWTKGDYVATKDATVSATGKTKGGNISVQGDYQILSSAKYDVSSSSGSGGTVKISAPLTKLYGTDIEASGMIAGGNVYIGGPGKSKTNIAKSEMTIVNDGSVINASSTMGKGGSVVVDSAGTNDCFAAINTKGYGLNGGGYIELSGDKGLEINTKNVNAGLGGTIYLDPKNIYITDSNMGNIAYVRLFQMDSDRKTALGLSRQDYFGSAISLYDNLMAVGAYNTGTAHQGAAYLFYYEKGSPYNQLTLFKKLADGVVITGPSGTLTNLNIAPGSFFGSGIAVTDKLLAIGASGNGNSGCEVYLWDFTGGTNYTGLKLDGIIGLSGGSKKTAFGSSLALKEYTKPSDSSLYEMLAVGAEGSDSSVNGTENLYKFTYTDSTTPYNGLGLTGMTLATPTPTKTLTAPTPVNADMYGSGSALSTINIGGTNYGLLGVGADGDVSTLGGLVYLYQFGLEDPSAISPIPKKIISETDLGLTKTANDMLGSSIALMPIVNGGNNYELLAIGSQGVDAGSLTNSGAAYLTHLDTSYNLTLDYTKNVTPSSTATGDNYGSGIALGSTVFDSNSYGLLAVGAEQNSTSSYPNSGAIYLYSFTPNTFYANLSSPPTKIDASSLVNGYASLNPYDHFGCSTALWNNLLAVGASGDDTGGTDTGAVYLYGFDAGTMYNNLSLYKKLAYGRSVLDKNGNTYIITLSPGDLYGSSVSLYNNLLAVGAPGTNSSAGAAYLYNFNAGTPYTALTYQGKVYNSSVPSDVLLNIPYVAGDKFGSAVSLYNNLLAIGASGDDSVANNAGAVYLCHFTPTSLSPYAGLIYDTKLASTVGLAAGDAFGSAVALYTNSTANGLAVGAPNTAEGTTTGAGAVYLFTFSGSSSNPYSTITKQKEIQSGTAAQYTLAANDYFGSSVALNNNILAIGAPGTDTNGKIDSGGAYFYVISGNNYSLPLYKQKLVDGSSVIDYSQATKPTIALSLLAGEEFGSSVSVYDGYLVVGAQKYTKPASGITEGGAIYLMAIQGGMGSGYLFTDYPADPLYLSPQALADWLAISNVVLQANNDIIFQNSVAVTSGTNYTLSLQSGRDTVIDPGVTVNLGSSNLTAVTNENANGTTLVLTNRDDGAADFDMQSGSSLQTTGNVSITMNQGYKDSTLTTHTESGNISLTSVQGGTVTINNKGLDNTTGSNVIFGGNVTAGSGGLSANSDNASITQNAGTTITLNSTGTENLTTPKGSVNLYGSTTGSGGTASITAGNDVNIGSATQTSAVGFTTGGGTFTASGENVNINGNSTYATNINAGSGAVNITANNGTPTTASQLYMSGNTSITGGTVALTLNDDAAATTGTITLNNVTGTSVSAINNESTAGSNLQINGVINSTDSAGSSTFKAANGGVSQNTSTSTITSQGTTTLSAGSAYDINLMSAGNNFVGRVMIPSGNNAYLRDTNALLMGDSTLLTNLELTAGGNITQYSGSAINVGKDTKLYTTGTITLDQANNDFCSNSSLNGQVYIGTSGAYANAATITDKNALTMGNVYVNNALNLNAGGAITQCDSTQIIDKGTTTLKAQSSDGLTNYDITLNNATNDFSTVAVTAGKNVSLKDANNIILGTSTIGSSTTPGSLTIATVGDVTGGAITQIGPITVNGTTALSAGSGSNLYDITLDNALNDFTGAVSINAGKIVKITDANNLIMGVSTIGSGTTTGELTLKALGNGAITQTGALNVYGETYLQAGNGTPTSLNNITLTGLNNFYGQVYVNSAYNANINNVGALALGNINVTNNLTLSVGGAITQCPSKTVIDGGTTTLTAQNGATKYDITLTNTGNDFNTVAVNAGQNVSLKDKNNINMGTSTVSGNLAITTDGDVTGGAITQTGPITVAGTTALSAGSGSSLYDITLTNTSNDFTGAVSISNGKDVKITDANSLIMGASTIGNSTTPYTGKLTLTALGTGAITQTGALNVYGTTTLQAGNFGSPTSTNNITLTGANNFHDQVYILDSYNANINDVDALAMGNVLVRNNLTLTAGGNISQCSGTSLVAYGDVTLDTPGSIILDQSGNILGTGSHQLYIGNISQYVGSASITNATGLKLGNVYDNGALTLVAGGDITQCPGMVVIDKGTTTLTAQSGSTNFDIDLTNTGNDFNTVAINAGQNVSLKDKNNINMAASNVSGNLAITTDGDVTGGAITQSGALTVAGATNLTAGTGGNLYDITLTTPTNDFTGAVSVSSGKNVKITDANNLIMGTSTIGSTGTPGSLELKTVAGVITQSGPLTVNGTTSLTAGTGSTLYDITLDTATNDFTGAVSVSAGKDVKITDANNLIMGTSTIGSSGTTGNLTLKALNTGAITQSGTLEVYGTTHLQAGNGTPTSANNVTLALGNNFHDQVYVDSAYDATINDVDALSFGTSNVTHDFTLTAGGNISECNDQNVTVGNDFVATAGATGSITQGTNATIDVTSGNLTFTGNGGISQGSGSSITVAADTHLNTTGAIDLSQSGNDFGSVNGQLYIASSGAHASSAKITDKNALQLGDIYVDNALNLIAGGAITQCADKVVIDGGLTTLQAQNGSTYYDITLNNANNNFNTVSVTSGNTVKLNDVDSINIATSDVYGTSPSGGLIVTSGGSINTSGNITGHNNGAVSLTATNGVNVTNNISTQGGSVSLIGNDVEVGTTGQTSPLSIATNGGAFTIDAKKNVDINGNTADNTKSTSISTGSGNVTVTANDSTASGASHLAMSNNSSITSAGAVNLTLKDDGTLSNGTMTINNVTGNTVAIANNENSTGSTVQLNGNINSTNSAGNLSITAAQGTITQDSLTSAITSAGTTTLAAGSGSNLFDISLNSTTNDFVGAVSVNSGKQVSITDANNLLMGISTIGNSTTPYTGKLTLTALGTGGITQNGILTVYGTTHLQAGTIGSAVSTNNINLTLANRFYDQVYISSAYNASITDADDLAMGNVNVANQLNLTAGNNIFQCDGTAIVTGGDVSFTAPGTIILDQPGNSFGGGVGQIYIGDSTHYAGSASIVNGASNLALGNIYVTGDLDVTAGGNITQCDGKVVIDGGTTTLTAKNTDGSIKYDITLANIGNDFNTVQIDAGKNVSLKDINNIKMATSTVSGNLDITTIGDLTGGAITQTGALTVAGTTNLTAGTGGNLYDITLTTPTNDFTGAVSVSSGKNVKITDANNLIMGTSTIGSTGTPGSLELKTVAGGITQSGPLTVNGTTSLTAGTGSTLYDITLDTATNDFTGAVSVSAGKDVKITDANNLIIGTSTIGNGTTTGKLTLKALGNGAITQNGPLNVYGETYLQAGNGTPVASNTITLTGANNFYNQVYINSAYDANINNVGALALGDMNVTHDLTLSAGGDITQCALKKIIDGGTTTINASSTSPTTYYNVTLENADNDFNTVVITAANSAKIHDTNSINLGTSNVYGTSPSAGLTVTADNDISTSGNITGNSSGAISLTAGGNVSVNNNITTQNGSVALNGQNVTVGSTTQTSPLSIATNGGAFTIDAKKNVDINGNTTDNTKATSISTGSGAVTVTANDSTASGVSHLAMSKNSSITSAGAVNLTLKDDGTLSNGTMTINNVTGNTVAIANNENSTGSTVQLNGNINSTNSADNLSITAAQGSITQDTTTSAITSAGTTTLAAGSGSNLFDISLNSNTNDFTGAVSVNSGKQVSITDANNLIMGTSTIGSSGTTGSLTLKALNGGAITQSGTLEVYGTTHLQAGNGTPTSANNVTLALGNNFHDQVYVDSAYDATINDVDALSFGTSNVTHDFTLTAGGNISECDNQHVTVGNNFVATAGTTGTFYQGQNSTINLTTGGLTVNANGGISQGTGSSITVAGDTHLNTIGNILLTQEGNNFGNGSGQLYIGSLGHSANSAEIVNGAALALGNIYVTGDLKLTARGDITQCISPTVTQIVDGGTTTLIAQSLDGLTNYNITLNNAENDFNVVKVSSAKNALIHDTNDVTIGQSDIYGTLATDGLTVTSDDNISTNGNITGHGTALVSLTAGDSVDLSNNITTGGGNVSVVANNSLPAGNSHIAMTGSSSIDAGTGAVTMILNDDASPSTVGTITLNNVKGGSVSISNNETTAGSDVTINGNITTALGGLSATTANGSITQNAGSLIALNNAGPATITANNGDVNLYGSTSGTGGAIGITAGNDVNIGATAQTSAISLATGGGTLTVGAGKNVNINGNTLDSSKNTTISTSGGAVNITANQGSSAANTQLYMSKNTKIDAGAGTVTLALNNDANPTTGVITLNDVTGGIISATNNKNTVGSDILLNGTINSTNATTLGRLTLTATNGTITQGLGSIVNVQNDTYLNSPSIINLSNTGNDFCENGTGQVYISSASTPASTASIYDSNNKLNMGNTYVTGALNLTSIGDITQCAGTSINAGGVTTLAAGSGNITLANATNDFVGNVVISSAGNVSIADKNDLTFGASSNSGTFTGSAGQDLIVNGALTTGGNTTLTANRSIDINSDINVVNGNFTATANNGPHTAGTPGNFTMAQGTSINARTGNIDITIPNNTDAGSITLSNLLALAITAWDQSLTAGTNVIINPSSTITSTGTTANPLTLCSDGGDFINNSGASALSTAQGQRWLIYTGSPSTTNLGGLVPVNTFYSSTIYTAPPTSVAAGNSVLYRTPAPTPPGPGPGPGGAGGIVAGGVAGGAAAGAMAASLSPLLLAGLTPNAVLAAAPLYLLSLPGEAITGAASPITGPAAPIYKGAKEYNFYYDKDKDIIIWVDSEKAPELRKNK